MSALINIDKIGSATSPAGISSKLVSIQPECRAASVGDVVAVRAVSESVTYGNLELPSGRLAKINTGDVLLGVLGGRRSRHGNQGGGGYGRGEQLSMHDSLQRISVDPP